MPYGFIGNACKVYLSAIGSALTSAAAVHNQNPYNTAGNGVCAPPPLPVRNNHNPKSTPDMAMNGGFATGVGNQTNVVVNLDDYDKILQKIRITDAKFAEEIYSISEKIEEMCTSIYIVPSTLPKYLSILEQVKSSLGEFQSLTEEARSKMNQFVDEIIAIDEQ